MKYLLIAFTLVIAVVGIQLTDSIDFVQNAYAQSSCRINYSCPRGKAVSAACSRKDACSGKDCVSTTSGCSISCTGDCSDGGGTGVSKGVIPGGDDGSGGNNSGGTGGSVNPCVQNPSSCQGGNNQPGGNKPGGNKNDPDDRCDRFPNIPGCRPKTSENPPTGGPGDPEPKRDISGTVWYDWDQNGRQTNGEPGIGDVRVVANRDSSNKEYSERTRNGGNYDIKNIPVDRYRVYPDESEGWKYTTKKDDNVNLNQGNERNVDFGMFKGYEVSVYTYFDMNGNGSGQQDPPFGGVYMWALHDVVSARVYSEYAVTNSQGLAILSAHNNRLPGLPGGGSSYTLLTYNYSPGFVKSANGSIFTIPNEDNVLQVSGPAIGFTPQWRISGYVYRDWNENGIRDGANEINLAAPPNITVRGLDSWNQFINNTTLNLYGNLQLNANGTFEVLRVIPGRYEVSYSPPPNRTSKPTKYTVTVGDNWQPFTGTFCDNSKVIPNQAGVSYCQTRTSSQGNQFNGSVQNLSFAVPPPPPWIRGYGVDIRYSKNFINKIGPDACAGAYASIPSSIASTALSSTTTPGVMATGDDGILDFAPGLASLRRWAVKNTYTSLTSELATSYDSVNAKAKAAGEIKDLVGQPGCLSASNCAPTNLDSGTYIVDGPLRLTGWNVSGDRSYVLLVNGDLTVGGNVRVSEDGGSLVVTVKEDIVVEAGVGQTLPYACGNEQPTIEGIFSADNDVTINTTGNCVTEKAFHVEGAIVANAALDEGEFSNKRTLCDTNDTTPVFTVRARPDLILNSPDLLRPQRAEYRELAP